MNSVPGHSPELAGRTALVTGAGSGIGRACAAALAAAGAKVHLVDRDEAVRAVAEELGGAAHVVDLAQGDPARLLPTEVDVLVNNAGLQHVAPVHEFPPDRFELLQRVMVTAPFLLARHVLPHMYARGWGRVVNVSSVHGQRASAFKSAYVAAKHGLEGLSKVIALEGAEHGVTSNCVSPGYVRTPLVENQIADQARAHGVDRDRVVTDVLLTKHAIKELVEPDEVAHLVLWLCGDHAAHVTGSTFTLDGGWTAQ
ncbi:3-hydroxybutyrate dehydrogenase [Saccharothrix variisporea]|uniref:3-hydroxybutyrate dehydrogenase n=1 Tax=Saccharothrix variisporea TaxID=543527 RepID=A0A495X9N7_9PSEU|nr:3-hydroxybutyrate dehydrogenase [Saccharothrix variisporea]RKT69574.1 3-hydroxybutyrate dehydrogenase [Saccharothrix variisporea]